MARKIFLPVVFAFVVTGTAIGHAGVVLDGTLGRSGPLTGPNYMINADLGKQAGGNLFHSFSSFNITRTESAVFRGPGAVENIISRVTGGSSSTIDGLLKSEIQGGEPLFHQPCGHHVRTQCETGCERILSRDNRRLPQTGRQRHCLRR